LLAGRCAGSAAKGGCEPPVRHDLHPQNIKNGVEFDKVKSGRRPGVVPGTVAAFLRNLPKMAELPKSVKPAADHLTDFDPPIWTFVPTPQPPVNNTNPANLIYAEPNLKKWVKINPLKLNTIYPVFHLDTVNPLR